MPENSQYKRRIKRLNDELKELPEQKKVKSKDVYLCSLIYLFVVFVSRWCVLGFLLPLHVLHRLYNFFN